MPPAEPRVVTPGLLRGWPLPEPEEGGTKHSRGTVLVVGGADSTPGAGLLTGLAALRVGAGRLQVATVRASQAALGVALPEAAVLGLPAGDDGSLAPEAAEDCALAAERASAVVVGPGLMGKESAAALLRALLPRLGEEVVVVVDGVALPGLAAHPELAAPLAGRLVLTPNGGEEKALAGGGDSPGALALAERYGAVVVTQEATAAPDGRTWPSETGGIGLGTSGSGDVLAGAVGGLVARGCDPAQAAVWGQYAHASAGDRLAARLGRTGYLARELLDELVPVLSGLRV